jgi:YgiT-type zinc finger domain-containing protein
MERVSTPSSLTSHCPNCGGPCEEQNITLPLRSTPHTYIIMRNVPAEVCQTCGETQFSMPTTLRLMAVVQTDRTPDDFILTPIFDFAVTSK